MMEKLLTFPFSTSQDRVDWVNRSKFNFFPEQHQHKPTKNLYRDKMRGSRIFLSGEGGESRLLNLFYSLQRGSNGFITHFPGGGGPTFSRGGPNANFYRNPYNYNL